MLEQLFGSRTRYKLLKLFLARPQEKFYIREVGRQTGERINSVRRELNNLEKLGIIMVDIDKELKKKKNKDQKNLKKFYIVDQSFPLYEELKELLVKSQLVIKNGLLKQLETVGKIKLLILTGIFVGDAEAPTDVLIVGTLNRKKLALILKKLEKSLGQEIRYTVMSAKEYKYRNDITDKFLYKILESKKVIAAGDNN